MNTKLNNKISVDSLLATYAALGYAVCDNDTKQYNLNIFGVRSTEYDTDTFNDIIGCFYKFNSGWHLFTMTGTTDPGKPYMIKHIGADGYTHIMKAGQYRGVYQKGFHKNKYPALIQCGKIDFYCDNDGKFDHDKSHYPVLHDIIGADVHSVINDTLTDEQFKEKSFPDIEQNIVSTWSAACQVCSNAHEYKKFMLMVYAAIENFGNKFSYTLLEEEQLVLS